jgi:hypothetical protein
MATTLYVKAPVRESVADIVSTDAERRYLEAKMQQPNFYTNVIRWTDSTRKEVITPDNLGTFIYEWKQRSQQLVAKVGTQKVVSHMYQKVRAEPAGDNQFKVRLHGEKAVRHRD